MPVAQDDRPVTKKELTELLHDYATKKDLMEILKDFATKKDLLDLEVRLRRSFVADVKVLNEQLVYDFRGALEDKISVHDDTLINHRKRIERLERRAGFLM